MSLASFGETVNVLVASVEAEPFDIRSFSGNPDAYGGCNIGTVKVGLIGAGAEITLPDWRGPVPRVGDVYTLTLREAHTT